MISSISITVNFKAILADGARGLGRAKVKGGLEATLDTQNVGLEPTLDTQNVGLEATLDTQNVGLEPTLDTQNVGLEATLDTQNIGLEATLNTQNQVGIMKFWLEKPVAIILNLVLLYHCSNQNQASRGSGWLEEQWLLGMKIRSEDVRNRLLYYWNHCEPCFSLIYSTSLTVDFIATPGDRARRPWGSVVNVDLQAYPVTHNVDLEAALVTQNQVGIMKFWLEKPVAIILNLVLLYHCSN